MCEQDIQILVDTMKEINKVMWRGVIGSVLGRKDIIEEVMFEHIHVI